MEEKRAFTTHDHLLGICQQFEIGLPWEDRWSKTDAWHGQCKDEQVGTLKRQQPESGSNATDQEQSFRPITKAERKRLLQETSDKLLVKAHSDPDAFMQDGSSQLNKLIDLASKSEAEDDAVPIAEIAFRKFKTMPPVPRFLAMLAPVMAEADDVRDRILAGWGLTPEVIAEMHAEMQKALEEDY